MSNRTKALVSALISAIMVAGQGAYANPNSVKLEEIAKIEVNNNALASNLKSDKNSQEEVAKVPVNNVDVVKGSQFEVKAPVNNVDVVKGPQFEVKAPINNVEVAKVPQFEVKAPVNNVDVVKEPQIKDFNKNKRLSTGAKVAIGVPVVGGTIAAASYGIYKIADFAISRWRKHLAAEQSKIEGKLNEVLRSKFKIERGWDWDLVFKNFKLDGWMRVELGQKKCYICFVKVVAADKCDVWACMTSDYDVAFNFNQRFKSFLVGGASDFLSLVGFGKRGTPLPEDINFDAGFFDGLISGSEMTNDEYKYIDGWISREVSEAYKKSQRYFEIPNESIANFNAENMAVCSINNNN